MRGAAVRVGGFLVGVLLSVASAALVLRHLGAEGFGRYTTVFALLAIVLSVTDAGTTNVGVREHVLRDREGRGRMLAGLQGLRLVLALGGAVCAVGLAVAAPYDEQMVLGTVLGGAGLVLTVLALTLLIPLQADLLLVRVTALELVRQAATVAALVALVAAGAGVAVLLGASVPAGLVLLAAAAWAVRGRASLAVRFDVAAWRALLRDTGAYTAATAVAVVHGYVTILVTSLVATEAQTGYLGAAHRIWYVLTAVPGLLVASAFPVLVRAAAGERLEGVFAPAFRVQLAVGAGLAVVLAAGAPVAIDVVAGAGYEPAVPVLRIQAAALAATALIALGGYALLALRRHRALLLANTAALATAAGLTAVLAASDGAEGAAVALLAGEVVLAGAYLVVLARAGLRPSLRAVVPALAAAGLAAVPGFALGLPALPAALGAAVVFAAAAVALRAIPPSVLTSLRGARTLPRRARDPR